MSYIFLKSDNDCDGTIYYAIPSNSIKEIAHSDTYDKFGQEVSAYDAGDSFTINSEKALEIIRNFLAENEEELEFKINDYVSAYEHNHVYDDLLNLLTKNCSETDFSLNRETVKGFHYYDGNNICSIIVEYENGYYTPYSIVNKELCDILNKEIEKMEFGENNNRGYSLYFTEDYDIIESHFSNSWEKYKLTKK